jgi:phosphomannomutase
LSNTEDLRKAVVRESADLGVAFDGDADRCGFVDELGAKVSEDMITALIAEVYLSKYPGATIMYDLRSSRSVRDVITSLGGKVVRSRVGHTFIKAGMRDQNALFSGELSGHFDFKDTGFTDNALFAMIQMMNLMAMKKQKLSEIIEPLEKYAATGEINMKIRDSKPVFAALEKHYRNGSQNHLDGLSIDYDTWWFNLRASNTEPLIRLNLEGQTPEEMESRKDEIIKLIRQVDPEMHFE